MLGLYELSGEDAPVRADAPPMLLLTGRKDGGARDGSTVRLARRLRAAGAEVAEIGVPGLDPTPLHRLVDALRQRSMVLEEIERFIRLHSLEFV
jgi:acetyl esterase/lipase